MHHQSKDKKPLGLTEFFAGSEDCACREGWQLFLHSLLKSFSSLRTIARRGAGCQAFGHREIGNLAHAHLPAVRVYFCYRTSAILFGNKMVQYESSGSIAMIRNRPVVTDDALRYQEQGHEQIVPV